MEMKRWHTPALRAGVLSLLLLSATSCSLMAVLFIHGTSAIYDGEEDVSSDWKFAKFVNKSFRTKQDMFYYKNSDEDTRYLDNDGGSSLPSSVEAYEKDPQNWMHTDDSAKKGHGLSDGYYKAKVFGVVKAGMKITIKKVFLHKRYSSLFGNSYHFIARIEEGKFSGREADITHLFKNTWESEVSELSIKEKILEEIN